MSPLLMPKLVAACGCGRGCCGCCHVVRRERQWEPCAGDVVVATATVPAITTALRTRTEVTDNVMATMNGARWANSVFVRGDRRFLYFKGT